MSPFQRLAAVAMGVLFLFMVWFTGRLYERRQIDEGNRAGASHTSSREVLDKKEASEQRARTISDLTKRYDADSTWYSKSFANTLDLQRGLLGLGGKPITLVGVLEDIWSEGPQDYVVQVTELESLADATFVLHCGPDVLAPVLKSVDKADDFAFIAQVESVRKPLLEPKVSSQSGGVELAPSTRAIVSGKCLAVASLR